ncbi:ABC transporter permease [Lederbergia lenta]|uniref:ABC transporter permease n=1 Tax=Lederbergia lenta TaxID=1467 RepID=UPI000824AE50
MSKIIDYVLRNNNEILNFTLEHIQLVGIATIIAILIGVPLGIYLTTNEYLAESILRIASIIMTIPSLALFGMMIPILSLIGQGIGFLPALIALVLYSQLPIIRNTYTGIKDVNPNVRDAAKAIGMSTIQRLVKVEIPIAMPLIMTGIRLATVMNIGIGAIAAFIGAGGLGVLINQGISRSNSTMVIVGAVAVSIMAIMADLLLKYIQKRFTVKGINS